MLRQSKAVLGQVFIGPVLMSLSGLQSMEDRRTDVGESQSNIVTSGHYHRHVFFYLYELLYFIFPVDYNCY